MTVGTRNCWICGNPADSREHKFKKSDLARSSATWAPADQPFFVSDSGVRRVQGPGSRLVTFGKVLCQNCNTTSTQPYDRAYEKFSTWVNQWDAALMTEPSIDFTDIYGENYRDEVPNLLKFFAKHLGCRLAADDYAVPSELVALLASGNMGRFEVSLSRNCQTGSLAIGRGPGILHNFPLIGTYSRSSGEVHAPYLSGMIVGYLDVIYRYDYATRYAWEGDPIDGQVVRLGEYASGAAHPSDGQIPGSESTRRFRIGGQQFDIPVLTPEHIKQIMSLGLPAADMTIEQNLDARIKTSHAILSPFYPEVTLEFLEDNLTIPDSDALWKCIFPSSQ
jgi:hypothetical protein